MRLERDHRRHTFDREIAEIIKDKGDPTELCKRVAELEAALASDQPQGTAATAIRAKMEARAFNHAQPPPQPHPIIRMNGKVISTPGNLTNIQAGVKAGKSAVVGAIVAAMFNGNRQGPDTLGFAAENVDGKAVCHFDTEQSPFDHDALSAAELRRRRIALLRQQERKARLEADSAEGLLMSRSVVKLEAEGIAAAVSAFARKIEVELPQLLLGLPLERSRPITKQVIREMLLALKDKQSEFWAAHPETTGK